jgi:hypothetical protein
MRKQKTEFLDGVDLKKLLAYVKERGGDGWIIWKPEYFTAMGFKREVLPIKTHKSSKTDPKWALTNDEGPVDELTGVYNLTMLVLIADAIGVGKDYPEFYSRGSQARAISEVVVPKLETMIKRKEQ